MRFPSFGNYSLDISGNVLEVFATGAWNLRTTENFVEDMHTLIATFDNAPWSVLADGRRWVLSTPDCQSCLSEATKTNIACGLRRSAYVLDMGMVKRAHLARSDPTRHQDHDSAHYQRKYFDTYFGALNWLYSEGYSPITTAPSA